VIMNNNINNKVNLILTNPQLHDIQSFHSLISEPKIQKEFISFRGTSIENVKNSLEFWINKKKELFPCTLRLIKLTKVEEGEFYDDTNSRLIGFVLINEANILGDRLFSGQKYLMNFAISEHYENNGFMTMALNMFSERLYENGYNVVSAFVKNNNPASVRILEKCGFYKVREVIEGSTYAKPLKIDLKAFKAGFKIGI
jgi:RimJ/RimL family protein N-acetyltransferase